MTRQRHYHPLAALRFLRKAVVVCLLPLANALLEFSLNALLTALRQDAALLLFLCGASSILLEASSWALDEAGVLRLRWAFISKRERIIRGEALAALTIERPLFFRLLGASRVVLYPVGQPAKRAVTLYLHKEDAQELADRLMPVRDPVCHRPAGGERAALVVLGANGLSTLALTYLAIRQSRPFPLTAEAVALSRLNVLVRFAAHWLPAGAAWMLVLTGSLFGISLARSFVQTVHYTVWHTADQLGSRGGWLSRFEFRVRSSEISYADVRVSPIARLMKRWPVFVVAAAARNCRFSSTAPGRKSCSGSCCPSSGCRPTPGTTSPTAAPFSLRLPASRSGCACCWCWSPAASCLPSRGHCSSRQRYLPSFWRAG